jgi:hypothetical protein
MSDNEGPVASDNNRPTPTLRSTGVRRKENGDSPDSQAEGAKEWESFGRASRRPSFLDNLADSRDSQFHVEDKSELERYFVCENGKF